MTVWDDLGFRDNPYSTQPVPADEVGERLLVGRDKQIQQLKDYIESADTHATIEGSNGVGKTSLVSIAAYQMFKKHKDNRAVPLFIPMSAPFQISHTENLADFKLKFLFALAQEIIRNRTVINYHHSGLRNLDAIDNWLNNPMFYGGGGGVSVGGVGMSASISTSPSGTAGFTAIGFESHLREMLLAVFPTRASGGFVCVLDNLELLNTSRVARETVESLRDTVLNFPGTRWVLCGARGIIRSVASTPRMLGRLAEPMFLKPLTSQDVTTVIARRIEEYKQDANTYVPVTPEGFQHIYRVGNSNLRTALKYCEDFVFWLRRNRERPDNDTAKLALLEAWFTEVASEYLRDTSGLGNRAWSVFDGIAARGGNVSPSDFAEFDFESAQAMRPHLKNLEEATLIDSSIDESDSRRKTITMTPRGWLVRYQRNDYRVPPLEGDALDVV